MRICVFGAASAHIDNKYINEVEELCKELASHGHSLVFGAGATGLMGAAARGFKAGKGYIHGVIPKFFLEEGVEAIFTDCEKMTYTETMAERKKAMEDDAEAFIIAPGGVGTFEEFFEVLTLKQLGRHEKAIVVFNIDGYYDELEKFMATAIDRKFVTGKCNLLYTCFSKREEVIKYLEDYKPLGISWKQLKLGE